jgi:hypothetical protein
MYIKKLKCYICGFEQEHHTDKWIKIKVNECGYVTDGFIEWYREHICPKCVMKINDNIKPILSIAEQEKHEHLMTDDDRGRKVCITCGHVE